MEQFDQDRELEQALADFKASVHGWSDAAYHRPRTVSREVRVRSLRLAVGWGLACALVAGSIGGGMLERNHLRQVARAQQAQRELEQERQLRAQQAAKVSDEVLLADVDSDVSRQVPSAMEPLAQMMSEDESK